MLRRTEVRFVLVELQISCFLDSFKSLFSVLTVPIYCYIVVATCRKTYSGKCCALPFVFHGAVVNRCLVDPHTRRSWCATTPNFDKEKRWGFCQPAGEMITLRMVQCHWYLIYALNLLLSLLGGFFPSTKNLANMYQFQSEDSHEVLFSYHLCTLLDKNPNHVSLKANSIQRIDRYSLSNLWSKRLKTISVEKNRAHDWLGILDLRANH